MLTPEERFAEKLGEIHKQYAEFEFTVRFGVEDGELSWVKYGPTGTEHETTAKGIKHMIYRTIEDLQQS